MPCHSPAMPFLSSDSGVQNRTLDPFEVHWLLGNHSVHTLGTHVLACLNAIAPQLTREVAIADAAHHALMDYHNLSL